MKITFIGDAFDGRVMVDIRPAGKLFAEKAKARTTTKRGKRDRGAYKHGKGQVR